MACRRQTPFALCCLFLCNAVVRATALESHGAAVAADGAWRSRQLRGRSRKQGDPINAAKLAELQIKLKGAYNAVAGVEDSLGKVQAQLRDAELVFTNVSNRVADSQHVAFNLSTLAASNRQRVLNITGGAFKLLLHANALALEVNYTGQDLNRSARRMSAVANDTERLLSLGQIKGRNGGCLDAPQPDKQGEAVQLWTCLKAQTSQQWKFSAENMSITHLHGICLATPPGQDSVVMWACDATQQSQQWSYDAASGLVKNKGGKCLSAADQAVKGSAVSVQGCDSASQRQRWNLFEGDAALRQQLDSMNQELWALANDNGEESLLRKEQRLETLEIETSALEASLDNSSRQTLSTEAMRQRLNALRKELRNLATSAVTAPAAPPPRPPCVTGPLPFGEDLGLEG